MMLRSRTQPALPASRVAVTVAVAAAAFVAVLLVPAGLGRDLF